MTIGIWPDWMIYRPPSAAALGPTKGRGNIIRDVAREILSAINGLTLLGPKDGVVWRGQADVSWRLQSKMGRLKFSADDMSKQERAMLREAREIGADNAQHLGDWEILARLRHHGAATRLIDFTTDPLVALWFLCEDETPVSSGNVRDQPGVLLAMQRGPLGTVRQPYLRNYQVSTTRAPAVLLYKIPPIDPRIAAQRGLFALHTHPLTVDVCAESELGLTLPSVGWRTEHEDRFARVCDVAKWGPRTGRPIEVFPELMGVEVPALVKPLLLEVLARSYGFTKSSIFPDFAGMGQAYSGRRI